MDSLCKIYGQSMQNLMDNLWIIYAKTTHNLCKIYGESIDKLCKIYG